MECHSFPTPLYNANVCILHELHKLVVLIWTVECVAIRQEDVRYNGWTENMDPAGMISFDVFVASGKNYLCCPFLISFIYNAFSYSISMIVFYEKLGFRLFLRFTFPNISLYSNIYFLCVLFISFSTFLISVFFINMFYNLLGCLIRQFPVFEQNQIATTLFLYTVCLHKIKNM